MTSNPILHDTYVRLHHMLLCVFVGIIYAVSYGITMRLLAASVAVDVIVSILLFYGEAIVLWSIFTYSRLEVLNFYQAIIIHIIYAVLAVAVMLSLEIILVYIIDRSSLSLFINFIPARSFTLFVMYAFFRRYYMENKSEENNDDPQDNMDIAHPMQQERLERIVVKVGSRINLIPVNELICVKAEDDYVSLVTAQGHWLKSERLKDYEVTLPPEMFVCVHRSYIVNISKIKKIERYGSKHLLVLSNGEMLRISATGYKLLKEKLNL